MKALSIKSPWAEQIRSGEKTIEWRSWRTSYRGPLLICCSKSPKSQISGLAVCIVRLDRIEWRPEEQAFAWHLENLKPIDPFPVTGRLNLFEVEVPFSPQ